MTSDSARWVLGAVGLGHTWVTGLLVDGLIAGVGMVLTFVPLMAIIFSLLAVLEGRFNEGDHIVVDRDPKGELTFRKANEPALAGR